MNDVFLQVRAERFQKFHSDEHKQEISENIKQTLNRNKEPRRRPDFADDQGAQVHCGKHKDHHQHSSQYHDGESLDFRKQHL